MIERSYIGKTMNRDERAELMTALYSVVPELAVFTQQVTLRYYDKQTRTLLTPKDIDELLTTIFDAKKTVRRVDEKRENAYEFIGIRTVAELLTSKVANEFMTEIVHNNDIEKKLVQPNYSEFQTALEHFAESIEYTRHSKLSNIKQYTEFAMSNFQVVLFGADAVNEFLRELNDIEPMSVCTNEPHWNDVELTVDQCPNDFIEASLLSEYELVKQFSQFS